MSAASPVPCSWAVCAACSSAACCPASPVPCSWAVCSWPMCAACSSAACSSTTAAAACFTGVRFILQIGHWPGSSVITFGCIPHVHSWTGSVSPPSDVAVDSGSPQPASSTSGAAASSKTTSEEASTPGTARMAGMARMPGTACTAGNRSTRSRICIDEFHGLPPVSTGAIPRRLVPADLDTCGSSPIPPRTRAGRAAPCVPRRAGPGNPSAPSGRRPASPARCSPPG